MNVSLFITCISDAMYPNVGKAVVSMLRRTGCSVDFPENQSCCGQPAFNSGYVEDTKKAAKQLIKAFEKSEWVVSPSGSCVSMVRHYYPTLFADDNAWRAKAQNLADKMFEFSEFMVKKADLSRIHAEYEGTATSIAPAT